MVTIRFTQDQAESLTHSIQNIVDASVHFREQDAATKAQLEIMREQVMSHLASLKKDMIILEKSEFSMLRSENEKLKIELAQLRAQIKDDMSNLHTKMALDINLERSRAKEDYAEGQRSIGKLDTRVTGELGNLRTLFEQYKNDIYKISAGAIVSCLTIILGFYRIWMWK